MKIDTTMLGGDPDRNGLEARRQLTDRLVTALAHPDRVRALFEGGSVARRADDEYSDLDLVAFAAEGCVEAVFDTAERVMEEGWGIQIRHRLPRPTWHGHEHCFYQLEGLGPFLMVDLLVVNDPQSFILTERERHGEPRIHFDPNGLVRIGSCGADFARVAREKVRAQLENSFPLYQHLVEKEIRRGRSLDAIGFYYSQTLAPLIRLARAVHGPERYDYGFRYLADDLPVELLERIQALAFYSSLEGLRQRHREAATLFEELWPELLAAIELDRSAEPGE